MAAISDRIQRKQGCENPEQNESYAHWRPLSFGDSPNISHLQLARIARRGWHVGRALS